MKILMFSDYYAPHIGGVEQVVAEMSRRLVARGHEVHLLTLNTERVAPAEAIAGVIVHRASALDLTGRLRAQSAISLQAMPLALTLARTIRPDVLHAHNLFFSTTLVAVGLRQWARRPLVTTLHLGAVDRLGGLAQRAATAYEATIGRAILGASDRVTAVSQAVADHAQRLAPRARITVVRNGVDLEAYQAAPVATPRAGRPRIALVGRLIFNKGPQYLVAAAPRVLARHPDAEFVIVGDGPLRGPLEATIAERGLTPAFTFLGQRTDVAAILREMTLLVRPSLSEGLPLTVLEAMACGLPVVATPVGGTAEAVKDGLTGRLVAPGNPDELAEVIGDLLDQPATAAAMGRNGRLVVERQHDWNHVVDQTLALYRELVGA